MNNELRKAKDRFNAVWIDAVQASHSNMSPYVPVPYTMAIWSGSIAEAYKDQWSGVERHPDGGWDWIEIRQRYKDVKDTIAALRVDNRLSCLAQFNTSRERVLVRFLEGDPRGDCKLQGIRVTLMLDLAFTLGQRFGSKEVRLNPVNSELEALYRDNYGFEMFELNKRERYMRKGL